MLDFCTVSKAEIQSCRRSCERDCARNPRQAVLHVENPCGFGYFTGFLLSQERRMLGFLHSLESRNPVLPSFLRKRLCKKPLPSRVACGKPLRVWLFYWVPAFAGTTNVGFFAQSRKQKSSLAVVPAKAGTQSNKCPLQNLTIFNSHRQFSIINYQLSINRRPFSISNSQLPIETVQQTLARSRHMREPQPNPLNPPYQGDFSLNSPLIRGVRGVRKDECWIFAQSQLPVVHF